MARQTYAKAMVQLSQSKVNLQRTQVLSPINGYVTNLQLRAGDYATKGTRNISMVDTESFWITALFEETKLAGIHPGDPAAIVLMGFHDTVRGHVDSIARGINTPNTARGSYGLASVDPVFTGVRLAQRIPVRIQIDHVPDTVHLSLGLTATVPLATMPARVQPGVFSRDCTRNLVANPSATGEDCAPCEHSTRTM